MLKSRFSLVPVIAAICFLFASCAVNRTIPAKHLDASIIPSDFNPQKHVLLIVQLPKQYKRNEKDEKRTGKMADLFSKYYPYKFQIVSPEEMSSNNSNYTDTSIYKYALINKLKGVRHTSTYTANIIGGGQHIMSPSAVTTYLSYSFLDRTNQKQYAPSYPSPYMKSAVEAFANTIKKAKKV